MKSRTFTDEVYGSDFVLLWNATPEQLNRHILSKYDKSYDADNDFVGRCIEAHVKNRHTIIIMLPEWHRSAKGVSILTHELFHATELALRYRDIKHSDETTEAWAYFLDSLTRRCLNILP